MDALLAQHAIAREIFALHQGHYLLVVKENQPELYAHIALLFQTPPVPMRPGALLTYSGTEERSHGRLEMRTLESRTALADYLAWPGAAQVMRRTYWRVIFRTGAVSSKTTYGITSLGRDLALPAQIEAFWRGHWTIEETKVHYVRDETLPRGPQPTPYRQCKRANAALRNGIISLLRHSGRHNIAQALRHYGASVQQALQLIGWPAT